MYMKKIFSFIAGIVAAMTLQAASYTEAVQITMSGTGGTESQKLTLIVDQDQATVATNPNIASTYEVGQVNIYVANGSYKYDEYVANAISNLPLTIVTNRRDASYTFTFNAPIITDGLTLTDLRSNEGVKTIAITHNGSYTFTVGEADGYEANKNITIADRFVINYVAPAPVYDAQVTTNEDGWASFSYAGNLAPVDASAQTLYKGAINGNVLDLYAVDYVKEDQGVLVKGAANTTYYFAAGSGSSDFAGNDLKPASAWESHTGTIFCLKGNALYEYTGSDMPANKAYLEISSSSAPARIILRFNEEQGIEDVKAGVQAEKFVENGQVFIRRGNEVFNLQGQIVK